MKIEVLVEKDDLRPLRPRFLPPVAGMFKQGKSLPNFSKTRKKCPLFENRESGDSEIRGVEN